jgi:hypothetical protein
MRIKQINMTRARKATAVDDCSAMGNSFRPSDLYGSHRIWLEPTVIGRDDNHGGPAGATAKIVFPGATWYPIPTNQHQGGGFR